MIDYSHIIYFQRCSSSYASSSQAHQATQVLHTLYIFSGVHQAMQVHYAIWPIFIMVFGQYYKSEVKIIFPYLLPSHLQNSLTAKAMCSTSRSAPSISNFQLSTFQSHIVRRSGSKLIPTFTIGKPERANFEE